MTVTGLLTTCAVVILRVTVSYITSVDTIVLWLMICLVNYVAMLLVVCQLSRDVIGYEHSLISNCVVRFDPSIVTVKLHGAELAQVFIK